MSVNTDALRIPRAARAPGASRRLLLRYPALGGALAALCIVGILCAPIAASAQRTDDGARQKFVKCAAVFSARMYVSTDQRQKVAYTRATTLLMVWAAELVPPAQQLLSNDIVTREFGREVNVFGEGIRKSRESAEAGAAFEEAMRIEDKSCQGFFGSEVEKRSPSVRN